MPLPALIPRSILFGNPERTSPALSPDGTRVSFLAPSPAGVLNVWVRSLDGSDEQMVTSDTHRGVRSYGWAQDGRHLIYLQDDDGDENFHLHLVEIETRRSIDLTPFPGVRAQGIQQDKRFPGQLLVGLNQRDRAVFDMYRVDLATREVTLDTENPGDVLGWLTDATFRIRGAVAQLPLDATTTLRVRDDLGAPWREIARFPFGESGGFVGFTLAGDQLLIESSLGSDTTRLLRVDARSGAILEELAQDPRCDVGGVMLHPDTHEVQAVSFTYLRKERRVFDPAVEADFAVLTALQRGEFGISSRDHADRRWIVTFYGDDGPLAFHLYDRDTQAERLLFVSQPALVEFELASMEPLLIRARDDRQLPSYLTLPEGLEARGLPLVLAVHGGPWSRDTWGYDPLAQWLANRGYAVLQVNFRGSTGFGKGFLNAGNGEWGIGAMQHDLTDAVRWAIEQGIADPRRVAIFGGSYGGYATLAGLTFTPELYACGVDIVGPSHLKTLLESIPPYWEPMRKQLTLRVGDALNDDALNRRISPMYHASKVRAPLLIAQGANDPRVKIAESDQMVSAMRAVGAPVRYVVYPDEGHGFARPANRLDFYARAEEFLAEHLGGRSEPWREHEGARVEVR